MAKKQVVSTIKDKLVKVGDSFTVNLYDNGYMFEMSGRDGSNDWKSVKIMCSTTEQLIGLINEASDMPRDE